MGCLLCKSGNQAEFPAEINIHFPGMKNLNNPGIFVFPKLLVCLDCGFSQFTAPETELTLLAKGNATTVSLTWHERVADAARGFAIAP